jgi:hypothetical protein
MVRIENINLFFPTHFGHANHRRRLEQSIRRAYASWRHHFPRWANTGFDEYFLLHDAMPLLGAMLTGKQPPDAVQLARTWAQAFGIPPERTAHALAELAPVAADFLARLQVDYNARQA